MYFRDENDILDQIYEIQMCLDYHYQDFEFVQRDTIGWDEVLDSFNMACWNKDSILDQKGEKPLQDDISVS